MSDTSTNSKNPDNKLGVNIDLSECRPRVVERKLESLNRRIQEEQLRDGSPWNDNIEELFEEWKSICKGKAKMHVKAGYIYKTKNTLWGLPAILVPIVMAPISIMIGYDECDGELDWRAGLNAGAFLLSGIFSGVHSFFKYGEQMERFFNYSSRYNDIVTDIQSELIKDRQYRVQAEVFIIRVKMLIDNLCMTEPVIPRALYIEIETDDKKHHGEGSYDEEY
jgi:hypothetical protein